VSKKAVQELLARPLELGDLPDDDKAEQEQDHVASYALQQVNNKRGSTAPPYA
jgi:hypothetical protein